MRKFGLICVIVACSALVRPALAQQAGGFAIEAPGIDNFAGLAIGAVPDYSGSDDYTFGIAPLLRLQLGKSERYLKVIATEASVNLVDSESWSFGPALNYRPGRDDVSDDLVDRMAEIKDTVEFGVKGGWAWTSKQDKRHRFALSLDFLQDIGSEHKGYIGSASAKYFRPVSRSVTLSFGVTSSYADSDFMSTYYSVNSADAATTGLAEYSADSGFRDLRLTAFTIFSLSKKWHLAGGLVYSRLGDEASDSPIVDQQGSADQFFVGFGFVYAW